MFRTKIWVVGIAALTAALMLPASSAMAQRRGAGGRSPGAAYASRGYYGGGYAARPYYGGRYYYGGSYTTRPYYGGRYYGYGRGYYGWPGVGLGVYGYPYYYYPGLYGYPYYYSPSNTVIYGTFPSTGYYYEPSVNALPSGYATPSASMTATLAIHVPPDARIWFDDVATQPAGEWRTFASPPLEGGKRFQYTIRAVWNDNGKTMDQIRTVEVRAGQTTIVDFLKPELTAVLPRP